MTMIRSHTALLAAIAAILPLGCQRDAAPQPPERVITDATQAARGATPQATAPTREADREQPGGLDLQIDKPGGLAFDGKLLWVADRIGGKLVGIDPETGAPQKTLDAPGPWPTGLAFDGELLWVADKQRARLFGIDTARGLVVREVEAPENPLGLAFDGENLWVADGKRLHSVTREDGTTIISFAAPSWDGGRPSEQLGLGFHDGSLWVSNRNRDRVFRVDPKRGDVIDALPSPGPFPAGVAWVGGRLLVADVDRHRVDVLTPKSGVTRTARRDERVVVRRRITNRGPGTLAEAHVWMAVPEDGDNQELHGPVVFEPKPTEVVTDDWGQKLAHFVATDLAPGAALDVTMTVSASLYAVTYHIDPAAVGSLDQIPAEVRHRYLGDSSKFALGDPSIRKHLQQALGGETRPYWMVRRIARHIEDTLHYEMVGGWNTAPTVLERGSGSCSEYTFAFIALCRAAGIPARYAGAVVVRGDDASTDEAFHRWVEVYLPGIGWTPYDAQGGDKPDAEGRWAGLGEMPARFLITTRGAGGGPLGWDYNSNANWVCRGRCDVEDNYVGDWYPGGQAVAMP